MHLSPSIPILLFSALAYARTDLTGCTRTDVSSPAGASYAWIVPGTGELCDFLDCGGGRAPPKTTVPGCPQYVGTETYRPSFLAGSGGVTATTAAPKITSSAAGATATGAVDDGIESDDEDDMDDDNDANDEGDADDIDVFYDLMINYPADWNNWTPEQRANWWSTYGYNSAATATATMSATMTGSSTSSSQLMASSNASNVASSTPNAAVSITTSTTSIRELPTLAAASTTTASISMSRSWVEIIPTFSRAPADVEDHRASVSASTSTSLADSTSAAGKVDCVFGGVGIAAVIGVLAVL